MSIAVHVGMLASAGTGVAGSGSTRDAAVDRVVQVSIRPAATISSPESRWDPPALVPERMAPIPRPAKLLPLPSSALKPDEFDEMAYVPASQLTVRPAAAQFIAVPYPKHATAEGSLKTVLAVFIDEDGTVAKVRLHAAPLPEPFARAAIETFSKAQFHPGRVGATPVKSRMLIEVEFDVGESDPRVTPTVASIPGKH